MTQPRLKSKPVRKGLGFYWTPPRTIADVMAAMNNVATPEEGFQIIQALVESGYLTKEEGAAYFQQVLPLLEVRAADLSYRFGLPADVVSYLQGYTSNNDLADRLRNVTGLDDNQRADIFDVVSKQNRTAGMELRQSQLREQQARDKAQADFNQAQSRYNQALAPRLQRAFNNPLSAPYLKNLGTPSNESMAALEDYFKQNEIDGTPLSEEEKRRARQSLTMSGQSAIDYLDQVNDYAARQGEINRRIGNQRGAAGLAALTGGNSTNYAGSTRLGNTTYTNYAPFDPNKEVEAPDATPIIDKYVKGLEGTVGGEGTGIRSYIESQIPELYQKTAQERRAWANWKPDLFALNPGGADSQVLGNQYWTGQYNRLTALSQSLPTDTTLGDTYYGEGGLAGIAAKAAEHALGQTYERPYSEDEIADRAAARDADAAARARQEDPLLRELKKRDWVSEYYRKAGTGLNRRTGAVRFA